jgi:hypothetical protein
MQRKLKTVINILNHILYSGIRGYGDRFRSKKLTYRLRVFNIKFFNRLINFLKV